jgi:hypothetical protein
VHGIWAARALTLPGPVAPRSVYLLPGDDYVLDGFHYRVQQAFEIQLEIGATFRPQIPMYDAGNWKSLLPPRTAGKPDPERWIGVLSNRAKIMISSIMVHRDVYERLSGSTAVCTEDRKMWARIGARYPTWYETEPLARYRLRSDSNTRRHVCKGR